MNEKPKRGEVRSPATKRAGFELRMRPPVFRDTVHEDIVKREPEFEYPVSQVVADVVSVASLFHARHL